MQARQPVPQFVVAVGQGQELAPVQRGRRTDPGDVNLLRPKRLEAADPPRCERDGEGCDLNATTVQFQSEQVVTEHGRHSLGVGQAVLIRAYGRQDGEHLSQEVPRAAAGV